MYRALKILDLMKFLSDAEITMLYWSSGSPLFWICPFKLLKLTFSLFSRGVYSGSASSQLTLTNVLSKLAALRSTSVTSSCSPLKPCILATSAGFKIIDSRISKQSSFCWAYQNSKVKHQREFRNLVYLIIVKVVL